MTETVHVDVRGETCPVPLIETRKALMRASRVETAGRGATEDQDANAGRRRIRVEIVGDHDSSFKEIPLLAKNVGARVVEREGDEHAWRFVLEKEVAAP